MKKITLLFIIAFAITFTVSANCNSFKEQIAPWEKPFTDPTVTYVFGWIPYADHTQLDLSYQLSDYTDNREWKLTFAVYTYMQVGYFSPGHPPRYDWVTMLYDVIVSPNTINGSISIPIYDQQYNGYVANDGDFVVYGVTVAAWAPL